jgi:dTDP-4-dehydrorhamnose 3,5-epimerase
VLNIRKTTLPGVLLIDPPTRFEDFRGSYVELYNREMFHAAGIDYDFVQDDISTSSRHVLRGIHGDASTCKLVSCLQGRFYIAVVNWDAESPHHRRWEGFTLSEDNRTMLLIPPKHGNGHVVLSDQAIFHYKQTTYYDRAGQFTLRYDDPAVGIWWPVKSPILSRRDDEAPHV